MITLLIIAVLCILAVLIILSVIGVIAGAFSGIILAAIDILIAITVIDLVIRLVKKLKK